MPGVSAKVEADGSFSLHHLTNPDATIFRILVANLPDQFTHPRVRVRPGDSGVKVPVQAAVSWRATAARRSQRCRTSTSTKAG